MNSFAYATPRTVEEAVDLLASREEAMVMAGGVDLVHEMKRGIRKPSLVVHLDRIPGLASIDSTSGSLSIGPLVRIRELETSPLVATHAPLLAAAAREVATPQLRAMGTVAGNILQRPQCWYYRDPDSHCLRKGGEHCHAVAGDNRYHAVLGGGPCHIVCPSDLAPALVALGAEVTVHGPAGERPMPIHELFVGPRVDPHNEHVLRRDEVITAIAVPAREDAVSVFLKARERTAWDFALASVSAVVSRDADGTVTRAKIVLGGVAPNPWDARAAADALVDRRLDEDAIRDAAEGAVAGARALRGNAYKIDLARNVVAEALRSIETS